MTEREALKLALEALEAHADIGIKSDRVITAIKEALAQPTSGDYALGYAEGFNDACKKPEQEPVAMKFKIYKPTVPDPTRQDINNALLPWVYDQDRSSGFEASMWVTPVATLPPQRKPLTDEEIAELWLEILSNTPSSGVHEDGLQPWRFARAIEAAHGIKG